jgi:hypothetical protein
LIRQTSERISGQLSEWSGELLSKLASGRVIKRRMESVNEAMSGLGDKWSDGIISFVVYSKGAWTSRVNAAEHW